MTITRCRACLAWDPHGDSTRDAGDDEAGGFCRRFAPRGTLSGVLNGEQGEVFAAFPITRNADGCCEGVPDVWEKQQFVPIGHTIVK